MKQIYIALLLAFTSYAQAQVVYTDLQPDYTQSTSGTHQLDLNGDGNADLTLSLTIMDPNYDVWFNLNTADSIAVWIDTTQFNSVKMLQAATPVPASAKWKTGNNIAVAYLTSGYKEGPWPGSTDKYFAFRITKPGGYQYGWGRMSVHAKVNNFTIKDYAYQSTMDAPISAGDLLNSAVDELQHARFSLSVHAFRLDIESETAGFSVRIYNSSGKCIHSGVFNNQRASMNLGDLAPALYVVEMENAEGVVRKKLLLQ